MTAKDGQKMQGLKWAVFMDQKHLRIPLTHLPLHKMGTILQMIFSDAFSWMKIFIFWLKFHWGLFLMSLFHWPVTPLCSYAVRKNEQIRSNIAEMVWWNISGATISHVLCTNCISMAHRWRTCGAFGAWMAMPLRLMLRMRTWPLRIYGASDACIKYIPRTRGDQRDSTVYDERMYCAWAAYMPNL